MITNISKLYFIIYNKIIQTKLFLSNYELFSIWQEIQYYIISCTKLEIKLPQVFPLITDPGSQTNSGSSNPISSGTINSSPTFISRKKNRALNSVLKTIQNLSIYHQRHQNLKHCLFFSNMMLVLRLCMIRLIIYLAKDKFIKAGITKKCKPLFREVCKNKTEVGVIDVLLC